MRDEVADISLLLQGDCVEVMRTHIESDFIDAIVTDPPYGLGFMGKRWDSVDSDFHLFWLKEAFRILKPGGSMFVMGGTRTFHRLMVAIEDSGFILKDTLMWIYGSGFPKAQDLGKMIDKRLGKERKVIGTKVGQAGYSLAPEKLGKNVVYNSADDGSMMNPEKECEITAPASDLAKHWDGFKIGGIKPAYEPIIWAVKPPKGSYIDNVLKWGVGAVNVGECRIETEGDISNARFNSESHNLKSVGSGASFVWNKPPGKNNEFAFKGRFPANIILDETIQGGEWTRFFYTAKASRAERNAGLDGMEKHSSQYGKNFSITGKGSISGSKNPNANNHPTVKPIKLFEYLIKLVTREWQLVLDPFLGSGTTGISAHKTNRGFVGIEKECEYFEIAKKRIKHWQSKKKA